MELFLLIMWMVHKLAAFAKFMTIISVLAVVIFQAIRYIPNNPPNMGVLTIFGYRTRWVLNEGYVFLPLYPFLFGVVLVDVSAKNPEDIAIENLRTPDDNAELRVVLGLTIRPDPDNLIQWLNSGGEAGIVNILRDVAGEAVRIRVTSKDEEPRNWPEAVAMGKDFSADICAAIMGKMRGEVGVDVIREVQSGNGKLKIQTLGTILSRANIKDVKLVGKLAQDAELKAREEIQRKAEQVEIEGVSARVKSLVAAGVAPDRAMEVIQTERGKIKKEIQQHQIDLSPGTAEAVKGLVGMLAGFMGKGKEK